MPERERIYLSPPHMGGKELEMIKSVLDSNWIAPLGPMLDAFERAIEDYVGIGHAAALSSGTAALHLALILAGVERGDDVWCSDFTFAASANPILYVGASPVFVDSDRISWNMNPGLLAESLREANLKNRLPKVLILVHIYGHSADIDEIKRACDEYDVVLIEDTAEALGTLYKGRKVGTTGKLVVFSFNGNKIVTTSGGGMLASDDADLIRHAKFLSTQARSDSPHYYEHTEIGYNYRLSNVLAAIGCAQMELIDERIKTRRNNFEYYKQELSDIPGLEFMPEAEYGRHNRWLTTLTINPGQSGLLPEKIRRTLEAENIESRPLWKPMHMQTLFKDCRFFGGEVSEELFRRGLCLPSGSNLRKADQDRIINIIRSLQSQTC